jgi:hypothetical protein
MNQVFPFGSPLKKVEQQDSSHKKVFVLGVYASAVHAKWIGVDGKVKVNALAVASEPYIFWKGDKADQIIKDIKIPPEFGQLVPADERFNGPSGKVLDEFYLEPLGFERKDAWLCDLLPYSRMNPNQKKAIETNYKPLVKDFNLPEATIPDFNPAELKDQSRLEEILDELEHSQANTIILLGDLPIKYFLSHFSKFKRLSDFGKDLDDLAKLVNYGKTHKIEIVGKEYSVIPLAHPRQVGNLGNSSSEWHERHMYWEAQQSIIKFSKFMKGKDPAQVIKKPVICPICHGRLIGTYVNEMPAMSEKLQRDLRKGKILLRKGIHSNDDPKYYCVECKFDFFEISE